MVELLGLKCFTSCDWLCIWRMIFMWHFEHADFEKLRPLRPTPIKKKPSHFSLQTCDGGFTLGSNHHQEMVARTFQEREKTAGQSLRRKVNSGIHLVVYGSWCVSRNCFGPTTKWTNCFSVFKVTLLLQIRAVGWSSWPFREGFRGLQYVPISLNGNVLYFLGILK